MLPSERFVFWDHTTTPPDHVELALCLARHRFAVVSVCLQSTAAIKTKAICSSMDLMGSCCISAGDGTGELRPVGACVDKHAKQTWMTGNKKSKAVNKTVQKQKLQQPHLFPVKNVRGSWSKSSVLISKQVWHHSQQFKSGHSHEPLRSLLSTQDDTTSFSKSRTDMTLSLQHSFQRGHISKAAKTQHFNFRDATQNAPQSTRGISRND